MQTRTFGGFRLPLLSLLVFLILFLIYHLLSSISFSSISSFPPSLFYLLPHPPPSFPSISTPWPLLPLPCCPHCLLRLHRFRLDKALAIVTKFPSEEFLSSKALICERMGNYSGISSLLLLLLFPLLLLLLLLLPLLLLSPHPSPILDALLVFVEAISNAVSKSSTRLEAKVVHSSLPFPSYLSFHSSFLMLRTTRPPLTFLPPPPPLSLPPRLPRSSLYLRIS